MKKLKGLLKIIFGRTTVIMLLLLIQISILLMTFNWLAEYTVYAYGFFTLLSGVVLIYIINDDQNSSFKLAWIIPVLLIPVFGTLLYIFVKLQFKSRLIKNNIHELSKEITPYLLQDEQIYGLLKEDSHSEAGLARYIYNAGGYPVYHNFGVKYLPLGEDKFKEMMIHLKNAKKYIFMEYFIVSRGYMWDAILEVLLQKVIEGVEVRFMYDGTCSLFQLPFNYAKKMNEFGIKTKIFSPIRPVLSTYQNNRDHRKILVIDGEVAFTGGINIGDEYINIHVRFGHWKDTSIMITGDAVKSFTMMFLQMWNVGENKSENYEKYICHEEKMSYELCTSNGGFIIPYGDNPFDEEDIGKQVYIDMLNRAKDYVHIMTPYLILDDEMMEALMYSAKRGVETIIIMPHIPDKIYAYLLARTYYRELIEKGVQIYEYTPGFIHAKVFISDDEKAVVGTINLDFRSLYLHFECAAYVYKNPEILNMEEDFQNTLAMSQQMTLEECKKYPFHKKVLGEILKLIAPLM